MGDRWIVLELGPKAEGEDPDLVRRSIRHVVKDAEVFIPAAVTSIGEERVVRYLVEGYAFVRKVQPDPVYLKLVGTRYVNGLLRNGSQLATVSTVEIDRMRLQVRAESEQGIEVGDTVMIMSGPYRQITAVVYEDIPELKSVQLFVTLRSKEALVTLPRNCLRLVSKNPKVTSFEERVRVLLGWMEGAWPIVRWDGGRLSDFRSASAALGAVSRYTERFQAGVDEFYALATVDTLTVPTLPPTILSRFERLRQVSTWAADLDWLRKAPSYVFDMKRIRNAYRRFKKVRRFERSLRRAAGVLRAVETPLSTERFTSRFMDFVWLGETIERIRGLGEEVLMIERKMAVEDVDMNTHPPSATVVVGDVRNIVVDGLNLAVRCSYAPGLSDLRDSEGRPTGVFYGFLNSLCSFRRRFPGAHIVVVWDGSSRRRKDAFAGYKASRGNLPVEDWQLTWLRGTLPFLGVEQAWNTQEEADDVMATLVSGRFAGQRNVVFSTDRDLMQVVSENTVWLSPAVGKAKETAYDPKAIEAKWGVGPERIVFLRALLGDTSDEIPGVGIPQKLATTLVQAFGDVDKLFSSKLAGMTKLQYDKLRASEGLVRRNVGLMTLHRDLPVTFSAPTPDRIAAEKRLRDADVKPDAILTAFFGTTETVK